MEEAKTKAALAFLCQRNPFDMHQSDYVALLMDFQDNKGDRALQALAGFYVYAIDNFKGPKQSHAIFSTFAHDLGGALDKWCEPRSSAYGEFWDKEILSHPNYINS